MQCIQCIPVYSILNQFLASELNFHIYKLINECKDKQKNKFGKLWRFRSVNCGDFVRQIVALLVGGWADAWAVRPYGWSDTICMGFR